MKAVLAHAQWMAVMLAGVLAVTSALGQPSDAVRLDIAAPLQTVQEPLLAGKPRHAVVELREAAAGASPSAGERLLLDRMRVALALRTLAVNHHHPGDATGCTAAAEGLRFRQPTRDHWFDRLDRLQTDAGIPDRLLLDLYRLCLETAALDSAAQAIEMAYLALRAGLPAEAPRVREVGLASGRVDKGIELLQQALVKGGLKWPDNIRLHLDQACAAAGNRAQAPEAFRAVRAGDDAADLARFGSIHMRRP
jgi:hypothetical protein